MGGGRGPYFLCVDVGLKICGIVPELQWSVPSTTYLIGP